MDFSTATTEQLQAELQRRASAPQPQSNDHVDTLAGLALHKPTGQITAEEKEALRQRTIQVLRGMGY